LIFVETVVGRRFGVRIRRSYRRGYAMPSAASQRGVGCLVKISGLLVGANVGSGSRRPDLDLVWKDSENVVFFS
jgi:hypothetical protein